MIVQPPEGTPSPSQDPKDESGEQGKPQNQPEYVTREQYDEMSRRLNGISGQLRQLAESRKPSEPQPKETQSPEAKRESAADKELKRRLEELERDRQAVRAGAQNTLLRQAVLEAGIPKERINTAVKVLRMDLANRVELSEDMQHLQVKDPNGLPEPKSLDEFLQDWLKGDEGQMFLPPKQTPKSSGGVQYATPDGQHPWMSKSGKEIAKLREQHPGLFADFVRNHRDIWERKKQDLTS